LNKIDDIRSRKQLIKQLQADGRAFI